MWGRRFRRRFRLPIPEAGLADWLLVSTEPFRRAISRAIIPHPFARYGPARIGRITFSKTGATLYYKGQAFQSLKGSGFKSNYRDIESGDDYWISGPRRDGCDALY